MDPSAQSPYMNSLDNTFFQIKMDIMMTKSEIMESKQDLAHYFASVLSLHLDHLKSKIQEKTGLRLFNNSDSLSVETESIESDDGSEDESDDKSDAPDEESKDKLDKSELN